MRSIYENINYENNLYFIFLVISANVFAQAEKENMMKKVEEWNKVFSKAMVEGDNKTILSFYVNDAYSLPSYSPMMVGKKN